MRLLGLVRGLIFGAAILSAPAAIAGEEPTAARLMMEKTGMAEQLSDMGEDMRAGILKSGKSQAGMPAEYLEAFADMFATAMEAERLLDDLETTLAQSLTTEEIAAVTAFYVSPLGERIKEAETLASDSDLQDEVEARAPAIIAELRLDPERLALMQGIEKTLLASELTATMVLTMIDAVGVAAIESRQQGATAEAKRNFQQRIGEMYPVLVTQMRDYMLALFALTYRPFTNEELEKYAEFLRSDGAKATYAAFFAALSDILDDRGEEIGREFATFAAQKRI